NTAFEKLIGKGRSQLLGYPADEVLPPALAELVEALEQSSLTPVAVTLVDGQGRKRAGHVRFRHFNAPDRGPGGVVGILVENGGE
ncbi:MAG: PAS domain-containing protein, partial [Rhodospirillales bacterium]|nr:PAS domain-containing protein [Rhodospirillales bacterium]